MRFIQQQHDIAACFLPGQLATGAENPLIRSGYVLQSHILSRLGTCREVDTSALGLCGAGRNYLPALLNTPELRVLQETQRVSLALPVCGDGTDSWVQGWTDVAKQFWLKAYGSDYTNQEEEEEAELLFKAAELVRASKTDLMR